MRWLPRPRTLAVPAIVGLMILGFIGYRGWTLIQAQPLEDFGEAPTFLLTDQMERSVRSEAFRGKVVVANFVYTNCPDICPLLSFRMKQLQDRLRDEQLLGTHVQLLSFTVDPARDTPAVLREYAERFQADPAGWRFLTGPEDEVTRLIYHGFHLAIQPIPPRGGARDTASPASRDSNGARSAALVERGGAERAGADPTAHEHGDEAQQAYEVMHSGRFALIDRQWRVRAWYDGQNLDLDRVMRDVRRLLP